jgi:hypothetical protein
MPSACNCLASATTSGLKIRPAATALACSGLLAVARGLELGDQRCLIKLSDGAEHLTDKHCGRRVLREEVRRRRGYERNTQRLEKVMAGELDRQVSGEAVRALSTMMQRTPLPAIRTPSGQKR